MPDEKDSRAEPLREARERRFAEWFEGRRWRVRTEEQGERFLEGHRTVYDHGEFWIDTPGVFQTPVGHTGSHGFILQEVDAAGNDIEGSMVAWGIQSIRQAATQFGAIVEVPKARRSPPKRPST